MDRELERALGVLPEPTPKAYGERQQRLRRYINLQLIAGGLPPVALDNATAASADAEQLLGYFRERLRLLDDPRCPADRRIEAFLNEHFADTPIASIEAANGSRPHPSPLPEGEGTGLRLPERTLTLDRHGVARELSLPVDGNAFRNELVYSYRVQNGVLHNPRNDRRTTSGTFHVCEGGLPVPADKKATPKEAFARLFRRAFEAPRELLALPYTANQPQPVETFVSLLLRPLVCPAVEGVTPEKRMEIRFFAPGGLVSNLDFVESIFGNGGDPFLPENDAGLDVEHWTGHTGAVILAPHLTQMTKRELGLPHVTVATDRQRRDGMCWEDEGECYNDGRAFKLTCRTAAGVIITLIADNYFGYCKKEVKTQISYATNLYGNTEEEHAGGAVVFPSFNLGEEFSADARYGNGRTLDDVLRDYPQFIEAKPEGYGVDRLHPDLIYIPGTAQASLQDQNVSWEKDGVTHTLPLLPGKVYITPSGYKVRLEKHPGSPTWRLIGTTAEGTFCHKPCTVSGGGKSEISKSLVDYMLFGPIFVADPEKDFKLVDEIFDKDYSVRYRPDAPDRPDYSQGASRKVLDRERSLGSVIKLLTPSPQYTDEFNAWLQSIPGYVYALVFIIKRFQKPEWNGQWREHFSLDIVNGSPGNELKYHDRKLVGTYLRVGLAAGGAWRTFKLRQDFAAAEKIQTEDDISASVVVSAESLRRGAGGHDLLAHGQQAPSYKFIENCEFRLFQRPDEAIHRGMDKQTEADLARPDNFISNFEPLTSEQVREMVLRVVELEKFTKPMKRLLRAAAEQDEGFVVCSAAPRMVNGQLSENPRYLQDRPDLVAPMKRYVAAMGARLSRAIPANCAVPMPVDAVLIGRRNNPPDAKRGIRSLAVYNPIHYQELPELFMDFICSLTGKSPSTTGAGSEGALTKGPFNALLPITDMNNALVSFILTGLAGFSTAAGHIGPNVRVDHDLSLLAPEVWCRLTPAERDPAWLIREGLLEPLKDFEHNGELILASRLGYRITRRFISLFFGRVFDNPSKVFDDSILRPELQDPESFADGIKYIIEAHQRVAARYYEDGSYELACPPLKAILDIMVAGRPLARSGDRPERIVARSGDRPQQESQEVRRMFTLEYLLESDWYRERLSIKQRRDVALWKRHLDYVDRFIAHHGRQQTFGAVDVVARRRLAEVELTRVRSPEYLHELFGTLGADHLEPRVKPEHRPHVPSAVAAM